MNEMIHRGHAQDQLSKVVSHFLFLWYSNFPHAFGKLLCGTILSSPVLQSLVTKYHWAIGSGYPAHSPYLLRRGGRICYKNTHPYPYPFNW